LTNILSTEILAEINREVVRTIYATANVGITSVSQNVVNLSSSTISDAAGGTSGRWQVEKYKSLLFRIEQAANKISKDTRRGKGNILIVSTDVASALAMTGLLDYNSALSNNTNLTVDDTGNTFAGKCLRRWLVLLPIRPTPDGSRNRPNNLPAKGWLQDPLWSSCKSFRNRCWNRRSSRRNELLLS